MISGEKIRSKLIHFLLALLFTAGLLMPLLGVLGLNGFLGTSLLIVAGCLLIMECAGLNRYTAWALAGISVLGLLLSLFSGGLVTLLSDILRALTLHLSDFPVALILVGRETALILSVLLAVLGFVLTTRNVGSIPSVSLCLGMLLIIWLKQRVDLLPLFLPAVIACLSLVLYNRHDGASLLRILPWSAAAVVIAFLLTPSSGILIPEWKNKTDELRQSITDTLFFTDPRNVFSISADGFYPQGINQLGGLAEPSDKPVIQVSAPHKTYLRGSVLNEYTGRNWINTTGGRRYLWSSGRWSSNRSRIFNETLPASGPLSDMFKPETIHVRLVRDSASTLFLPQRIHELRPGGNLVPYFNSSSEIFITRDLQAGDTYTVTGLNYIAGDAGLSTLVDACASLPDPDYASVLETYTALPMHLEQMVFSLAHSVTDDSLTPYAKAFALQNWLSRNFRYTLNVADQPENMDFVTNFLFNTKEGYCTYFASAMTVLSRIIGLPSRYVEGYVAEPDETGNAVVTGLNAHAWTEIYFSGLGWVTFDATPKVTDTPPSDPPREPDPTPTPEPPEDPESTPTPEPPDEPESDPTPSPQSDPTPTDDPSTDPLDREPQGFPWFLLLILLLLALAAVTGYRIVVTDPERKEKRAPDLMSAWLLYVQDLFDLLRVNGLVPRSGETPMAFMRRCDMECVFSPKLDPLGQCISLICYAHVAPVETDIDLFRETVSVCRSGLTPSLRLRYLLLRAFVPLKKRSFEKN